MSDVTYDCVLCPAKHTAKRDSALALLKICKGCGEKRYRKGKAEERKAFGDQVETTGVAAE